MARRFDPRTLPGFGAIAALAFALLYLPLIVLVAYSFNAGDLIGRWEGLSWRWYAQALDNAAIQNAALRSLVLALVAAALSTALAVLAALATTRADQFRPRHAIAAVVNQPLVVPEIVMAVALLLLFSMVRQATGLSGMGYLLAAHVTFCIPFAYLPVRARLEGMDANLERAAADLYASPLTVFRRITLPLLAPGILAGFMLAFVISLDNVVISQFIKTAGQETLPTYMLGQLRRGISAEIYAVSTMLVGLSLLILTLSFLVNRRRP